MSNTGWAVVVIVLIILLGGGWWYYSSQAGVMPATDTTATNTTATGDATGTGTTDASPVVDVSAGAGANAANTVTVHLTASGFSPSTVTIKKGQAVNWIDDTSNPMWIASNNHPTHALYDGTSQSVHCAGGYTGPTPFDECQAGTSFTFVFSKAGTFGYHDHAATQLGGTVVVQ